MELTQVDEMVGRLLTEVLFVPPTRITDELTLQDIEAWDSLKHMEFIATLETEIKQGLTFDEIVAMQNVGAIKQIVRAKVAA